MKKKQKHLDSISRLIEAGQETGGTLHGAAGARLL